MKEEQQPAVINALLEGVARDRRAMSDAIVALNQRIEELNSNAKHASTKEQEASKGYMRWLLMPAIAIAVALWLYVPSPFSIQDMREEKAKLTKDIAKLRQSGANADVITCEVDQEIRFCAKIDKSARGDWAGYQIIQNK
ncbi:MAG: hypothetical protein V4448_14450 [Pseudomonadota bacterium]